MGFNDQIMPREGEFHKCIFLQSKNYKNLEIFGNHEEIYTQLTAQIGDRLHQKNIICTLCLRGWGFHAKPIFLCILLLPSCNSDSWRRYTLKYPCWCVEGKVGELFQSGGVSEDCLEVCFVGLVVGGNCMVPCCSCHMYGI